MTASDPRLAKLIAQGLEVYEQRREQAKRRAPEAVRPMVLTVWQPWAWAIIFGTKRIENRSAATIYRGRMIVHVGKGPKGQDQYIENSLADWPEAIERPSLEVLRSQIGHAIGEVNVIGCLDPEPDPPDPWAVPGQWGWQLARPTAYARPFKLRGQQGLFALPHEHQRDLDKATKRWRLDALDVVTTSPHQAVLALQLANVSKVETTVMVNGRRQYFGELVIEAARWSGDLGCARAIEQLLAARVSGATGARPPLLGSARAEGSSCHK